MFYLPIQQEIYSVVLFHVIFFSFVCLSYLFISYVVCFIAFFWGKNEIVKINVLSSSKLKLILIFLLLQCFIIIFLLCFLFCFCINEGEFLTFPVPVFCRARHTARSYVMLLYVFENPVCIIFILSHLNFGL